MKNGNKKNVIAVMAGIVLVSVLGLFIFSDKGKRSQTVKPIKLIKNNPGPTIISPTPVPFYELTIPYLRQRSYQSQLLSLEQISTNTSYASYLASYDSDGFKIYGLLTIPGNQQPSKGWPAIIFIHGYIPPKQYRATQNYASYVDYFARRGFVVYKIDLRGHGKSEGEANGAYYSSDYIIDTLNALSALQKQDFVNGEKIGLWGHSMAGNVVLRAMTASDQITAAVIWAGAVYTYEDFSQFRIDDQSYQPPPGDSDRRRMREKLFNTHGRFDPDSQFWAMVAPTNYFENINAPLQIHHAENDNVVSIDYSRNLKKLVEGSNINLELYEYTSGGHNLTGSAFTTAMQRSTNFFAQNLN